MRRIGGVILFVIGLVATAAGVVGISVWLVDQRATPSLALMSLIAAIAGAGMLYAGSRAMSDAWKTRPRREGNYLHNVPVEHERDGMGYTVLYTPAGKGKKGKPSMLTVTVPATTPSTMQLNRETWLDRLAKSVGIASEHQTHDDTFDDLVYVRAASEGYAARYLAEPQRRAMICDLLNRGFGEVRFTGNTVEAVWQHFNPTNSDEPGLTDDTAVLLIALADEFPAADPDEAFTGTDVRGVWNALLWLVAIAFAISTIFGFAFPPLRSNDLLHSGLLAFLFVYPAFGFVAAFLLRGGATSHDRWLTLVRYSLVLLGLGSFGGLAALNGMADTAQPTEHVATVIDKAGRSRTHYAVVPDWDRPGELLEIQISAADYERLILGRTKIKVTTCPGLLNIEWIKASEVQF